MEAVKETKFGICDFWYAGPIEETLTYLLTWGMRMMPELLFWRIHAERARDTTLNDEK